MDAQMHGLDLADFPVDAAIEIDGMTVCLQVSTGGALLSAELDAGSKLASVMAYLELGFSNALEFEAGLALDPARRKLVLTHWLAGVSNWASAATSLESLLNQVDVCRAGVKATVQPITKEVSRQSMEKLLRARLSR